MALGLGNQLHVLFWTDNRQLWYTKLMLGITGQSPLPTPTTVPNDLQTSNRLTFVRFQF